MRAKMIATATLLALASVKPAAAADTVLPLPTEDEAEITRVLGPNVVGRALPSQTIDDASIYFPLVERSAVYEVTSGSNKGKRQTLRTLKGKRPGGNDAWRFELSPSLAAFVNQTTGDLVMPAVSDTDEGVIVVTTPPNPFVLNGMKPGETRRYSQQIRVNYLDDPTDTRYSGSLEGTYTYVGTYEVTVPAGIFPSVLLRQKYAGKVGPAHTEDTAYYFFAPRIGVVAMISQEDVEAFWIIHLDTTTGKVLGTPPSP
jgi:hypothetical protein